MEGKRQQQKCNTLIHDKSFFSFKNNIEEGSSNFILFIIPNTICFSSHGLSLVSHQYSLFSRRAYVCFTFGIRFVVAPEKREGKDEG